MRLNAPQSSGDEPLHGGGWLRIPFAFILILCGVAAYSPALDRVFAGDQLGYFAELHGDTSLRSGLRLLDYGVQRQYSKGDQLLYRPLLFAGLALENTLFGRDLRLWNAANLGLHLAISYLLFEILWRTRRSLLAYALALWFALLMSNFELVTWNHLGGYMLGYGLLLLSLYARGRMEEEHAGGGWFWTYGVAITGAMMEHEIAVIACVCLAVHGVWLVQRRQKARGWRWIFSLGLPLLVYGVLFVFHALRCDRLFWVGTSSGGSGADSLADWPSLLLRWAQHILLPRYDQLASAVGARSAWLPWPGGMPPMALLSVALWALWLVSLRRGWTWQRQTSIGPFGNFLIFLIVAYAGMNLMGRPDYVMSVPYYDYFPALLGAVWVYSRIDFSRVGRKGIMAASVGMVMLALINGWQVRRISTQVQELDRPWPHYLGWVEKTVRPRLSEDPGFTFSIAGVPAELNPYGELTIGFPDQNRVMDIHVLNGLYGAAFDPANPAEVFVYPGPAARGR
jgi:hypothetical protein